MSRTIGLSLLLVLAACASTEPTSPVDQRGRYLTGYATTGPVEPAEYSYEDRGASLRFPPPGEGRTFTKLSAEALDSDSAWSGSAAAGLADDEYDPNADFGFYGNEYGGSRRWPRPGHRPRPPVEKPPEKPEPPVEKPVTASPTGETGEPTPGPEERRKAKSAPERPERSRDGRKPPETPKK